MGKQKVLVVMKENEHFLPQIKNWLNGQKDIEYTISKITTYKSKVLLKKDVYLKINGSGYDRAEVVFPFVELMKHLAYGKKSGFIYGGAKFKTFMLGVIEEFYQNVSNALVSGGVISINDTIPVKIQKKYIPRIKNILSNVGFTEVCEGGIIETNAFCSVLPHVSGRVYFRGIKNKK